MSYALEFDEKALKQFEKLDSTVANQFLNKLDKVLENPHIEKNRLRGQSTLPRYKIKLRTSGYRLVYEVNDNGHCCKVSDEAAFCLIQRPYISKTLLTRRISPRGSP